MTRGWLHIFSVTYVLFIVPNEFKIARVRGLDIVEKAILNGH